MKPHGMKRAWMAALALGLVTATGYGQETTPAGGAGAGGSAPVTREEFDKLLKELTDLHQEVTQLKQERAAASTQPAATTTSSAEMSQLRLEIADLKKQRSEEQTDAEERQAEIDKVIKDVMAQTKQNSLGQTKLLITGDADVGFTAQRGSPNTFEVGVAPRFLWKLNDQLMFDAAFDVGVGRDDSGGNSTTFDLTIASATYILNDYLVVGGGVFVAPFAAYHRDFDPSWINKLPDDPLVFSDNGLAPSSVLGAFVSGAYPIGTMKVNYAAYLSNGPELITSDPNATPTNLATDGSLDFSNFTDLNNNKAVGARIGFLPIPQLEVGYSFLCGQASPADATSHTNAFLQAVDFNYGQQLDPILGTISFRTEWVWSNVGNSSYVVTGSATPVPLDNNNRNGGYVQLAYRPTLASIKVLRNLEGIVRYDRQDGPPNVTGGGQEQRLALGLDYWLDARSVIKVAYEFDKIANGESSPAFMLQFGVGF